MKLATFCTYALAFFFTGAHSYPITSDTLNCRSGPGTAFAVKKTYKKGQDVSITCQTEGDNVSGSSIWDKTSDGCYVSDYYVKTGSKGYVKGKCTNVPKPPKNEKIPGPMVNDYPYKNSCGPEDKWNYFKCQCTSFVAWRINERLGVKFHNQYKGYNWGNANEWDDGARATGVHIDDKPVPGCVAQTNAGQKGHVAWVTAVNGDTVTIEEYNWNNYRAYGTRKVPKNKFKYIHIKV
ncbi:CHAP domain-containing protein [Dactylonectria estremocensis]|uniref:CHAP domain-containing protein n=1 Tax=Dactylonectria estremocensis TaxID=1079267 RepID=A0A9P9EYL5_9HYPO|nr:CHAP domain-containing protein [Dactylonectria estremocensis]